MKNVFLLIYFVAWVSPGQAQNFKQHIVYLTSDSLHGRAPATTGEIQAAKYIAAQFKAAKCRLVYQKFPFEKDSAINVLGFLDFKRDSTIIISAHYDHLGYGGNKSKEILKKGIHPGADDNASGVAMMIELAKVIGKNKRPRYNFVFAAYSAHEAGLFGSEYFSKNSLCRRLKLRAVINLDMIGRLDTVSKTLRVGGAQTDSLFSNFFSRTIATIHYRFDDSNINLGDLKPFAEKGIAVLHFTTGIHDDYHRMSDIEEKINYTGMKEIFRLIEKMLKDCCLL
jgi:aminopeptidase-like protein